MSALDRDALIEATVKALVDAETNGLCGSAWPGPCDMCDCVLKGMTMAEAAAGPSAARERARIEHVLSKVLPLIADAIEADAHALKHRITAASADLGRPLARTMLSEVDGRILAARLVRSLLAAAEQDEPNPFGRALHVIGTPTDKTLLEALGLTAEQDEQDEPKRSPKLTAPRDCPCPSCDPKQEQS